MNTFRCGKNANCDHPATSAVIERHIFKGEPIIVVYYLCNDHRSDFMNQPVNGAVREEKPLSRYLREIGHPSMREVVR